MLNLHTATLQQTNPKGDHHAAVLRYRAFVYETVYILYSVCVKENVVYGEYFPSLLYREKCHIFTIKLLFLRKMPYFHYKTLVLERNAIFSL